MLGMFSGNDVVVADNTLNSPQSPASGCNYFTYDDTKDEFIHGDRPRAGQLHGGGLRQRQHARPRSARTDLGPGLPLPHGRHHPEDPRRGGHHLERGGTGYVKRYAYDQCGATAPTALLPHHGPLRQGPDATGWTQSGFDVGQYFEMLTAGGLPETDARAAGEPRGLRRSGRSSGPAGSCAPATYLRSPSDEDEAEGDEEDGAARRPTRSRARRGRQRSATKAKVVLMVDPPIYLESRMTAGRSCVQRSSTAS